MICETGRVTAIEGSWVLVETFQISSCKSCSAKAGCGQSVLGSVFSGKRHQVRVSIGDFSEQLKINDQVELAIDDDIMLRSSVMVYLLPLFAMIVGAVAGPGIFTFLSGDMPALLGAAAGFILACLALRAFSVANADNPKYQPVLHKILSSAALTQTQAIQLG
ncbi:MAG: SoxR reducing system RseC family protein [Pseudomonadales bacterium]|nr:SoxR reducing system RseC family protein [Pseudomonadales bacterium]